MGQMRDEGGGGGTREEPVRALGGSMIELAGLEERAASMTGSSRSAAASDGGGKTGSCPGIHSRFACPQDPGSASPFPQLSILSLSWFSFFPL